MTLPPAIILAAGESSRFWPLSTHGHKSLHRLCGKSVIEHTVESLVAAGVTELIIVQSPIARAAHFPHRTINDQLGDGSRYGARIRYVDQDEARGTGPALRLATQTLSGDYFVVWPEGINAGEVITELWQARDGVSAVVAGQEREETWLFGVFALKGDLVTDVVEKPKPGSEPSKICNMAVGLFGDQYTKALADQPDHEIANIFALQALAKQKPVRVVQTPHRFFPLKYPWHLFAMADHLRSDHPNIDDRARIDPSATVDAETVIEKDAVVGPEVVLKKSLIGAGSRIESNLSDTIVGAAVTIESEVTVQQQPLEGGHVVVDIKGHQVSTGLPALGATIGQGSTVRSGVIVSAGVLIGAETEIATGVTVAGNVGDRVVETVRQK